MTVAVQTPISSYTGNGVTTAFSFGYYVAAAGDLVVMVDGVVKALTTDYTLTGIGSGSGGTCTFVTAPASGADVVLYRDTDLLRETDYQDNGDLLAAILNGDFDRIWLALQETITGAKLSPRAIRAPIGETLNELSDAASRAGKILSFNATTGQPEAVAPTSGTATDLAVLLASAAGAAQVGMSTAGDLEDLAAMFRTWVCPTDPRFGGISGGSWHTAINAAATYAAGNGYGLRFLPQAYPTNDTVTFPSTLAAVDMRGAYLSYSGTRDRPILTIGATGVSTQYAQYLGLDARAATIDWTNTGFIAIKTFNLHRCKVDIFRAVGAYVGFDAYCDQTQGWAYNEVKVGWLQDCARSMRLTSVGVNCFVNENTFYSGRYGNSSSAAALGTGYGVEISSDGNYVSHNNNRWICPTFEVNPTSAAITRIPFYFNGAGSFCMVQAARHEASGGVFALCDGLSRAGAAAHNVFDVTYVAGSQTVDAITQQNGAIGNQYNSFTPGNKLHGGWIGPDPVSCIKPRAANASWITGPWSYYTNGSTTIRKVTDSTVEVAGRLNGSYLRISNSASVIGVEVRTDQCKQWMVRVKAAGTSNYGRLVVRCFDSAGAQITTGTAVTSATYAGTGAAVSATALFGNAYQSGADGSGRAAVLLFASTVETVHIGVSGGSQPAHFQGLELYPMDSNPQGVSVYCSIGEDWNGYATADPDTVDCFGAMRRGETVYHGTAAIGSPQGWMCTTAGSNALPWVTGTAYVIGQRRYNGANVYVATTSGTSGATAPTGTGTGISDGAVTWDFLETRIVTSALPNL